MNRPTILRRYSQALAEAASRGDAREESFYASLSQLLTRVAEASHRPNVHVTTLPRPTEAGNPDFRVWNGADRITGYIEAKSPTEGNLTAIESSEQLRRYRDTCPDGSKDENVFAIRQGVAICFMVKSGHSNGSAHH